jgi:hypothetical protein
MSHVIRVEAAPTRLGWDCDVEVLEEEKASRHNVRVSEADLQRLGRPSETPEELVTRTFEFLLAREPAEQILKSFALSDVQRYHPEFEREISSS